MGCAESRPSYDPVADRNNQQLRQLSTLLSARGHYGNRALVKPHVAANSPTFRDVDDLLPCRKTGRLKGSESVSFNKLPEATKVALADEVDQKQTDAFLKHQLYMKRRYLVPKR